MAIHCLFPIIYGKTNHNSVIMYAPLTSLTPVLVRALTSANFEPNSSAACSPDSNKTFLSISLSALFPRMRMAGFSGPSPVF